MKYRKGYKYQLAADEVIICPFAPDTDIVTEYIRFNTDGILWGKSGYAWDGPSGPTFSDTTNIRGSLYHDMLSQLARMGLLPFTFKGRVDQFFVDTCMQDGMSHFRAEMYYDALHLVDDYFTAGNEPYPVFEVGHYT